jgi:hypothetical protein
MNRVSALNLELGTSHPMLTNPSLTAQVERFASNPKSTTRSATTPYKNYPTNSSFEMSDSPFLVWPSQAEPASRVRPA